MVKVLIAPIRSLTGDSGAELLMVGAPEAAPTVHVHTFWSVPLLLFTRAVTFQVPADALALVQFAVVTPVLVLLSSVPLRYQLTFTVWSTVILNVLDAPTVSVTEADGAKPVMLGAPASVTSAASANVLK